MKGNEIDEEELKQYAESGWSDTFASYNSAVLYAREILRLRRQIKRLKAKKP